MIVYLIGFLSFVFEFVFNKILYNSIFIPLIIITTLVVLEPYFSNKKKYFIYCFLIGFLCDLFYTNSILVNASLFLILGIIVYGINVNITNNKKNVTIIGQVLIVL
jgi:cell shape-determining protein MreD